MWYKRKGDLVRQVIWIHYDKCIKLLLAFLLISLMHMYTHTQATHRREGKEKQVSMITNQLLCS